MNRNEAFLRRAQEMGRSHVTARQAAEMIGVCIRTIRYWQSQGKMPERVSFGRTYRYPKDKIEEMALLYGTYDV